MNFHVVSRGGVFNFDFPVGGGGRVNIHVVYYSHKGTASILFYFPKCPPLKYSMTFSKLLILCVQLLNSYLSGRKQQLKLNSILSTLSFIKRGVPQVSILGPLLFNVFLNNILYFIEHGILYDYADDNAISFSCPDFDRNIQVICMPRF